MTTFDLTVDLPEDHPLRQILSLLEAHPEVREPVLRALLTEDFLALPERVQALTERVDRLAGEFEGFREETREQFRNVHQRLEENTELLRENIVTTRRLEGQVGRWRGSSYEDSCRYFIGVILDGYPDGPVLADREIINSQLRKARRANLITRQEYQHGLSPDIIARGEDDAAQTQRLAVVEASVTFNQRDLENAAQRAAIIARVTGVGADAFVATHYPWPEAMELAAKQLGVSIIQLESEEHAYDV